MNKERVEEMIADAETNLMRVVSVANKIIESVLAAYEEWPHARRVPNEALDEDEAESIRKIKEAYANPEWYKSHDSVWTIFLELKSCKSLHRAKNIPNIDLTKLELSIDPMKIGNIRSTYERKYLDTPWKHYDGDLVICNPFDFISSNDFYRCPSLLIKHTLDDNTNFYTVTDPTAPLSTILGSVVTTTNHIGVILAKELWEIPSANDALRRADTFNYTFIKQFHGKIRSVIEETSDGYHVHIEGVGSQNFQINRLNVKE